MTYIPDQDVYYEQLDTLKELLTQIKIIKLHLQSISNEEITEEDTK